MPKIILYLILLALIPINGCTVFSKTPGAKSYSTGQYFKASNSLKKEFNNEKRKNIKGELAFLLGESYRKQNLPAKAASSYSKAIKNGYQSDEVYVYWGQALLKIDKITEAEEAFNKALAIESKNKLAKAGLKSCELKKNNTDTTNYIVSVVKSLNSKYSDFGVAFDGDNYDHIFLTSMRYAGKMKGKSTITGQGFSNLYESSKNTKGEWTKPLKLEEPFNSPYDDGAPFITPDGKELYFSRCVFDKTKLVEGQIYKCIKGAGIWGPPELLTLFGDSILVAHPTLSEDGQTLFFVSDMPGSKGGKDIWKTTKDGEGVWGKPKNLGYPINTNGNEMYPYVRDDKTLYFASDGQTGFGGLDIYKATQDENGDYSIQNMGIPINSSSDDFAITFMGRKEQGFISSSRGNTKGVDHIFSFILPEVEFKLAINVIDAETQKPIKESYMKIIGSNGTQLKIPIPTNGQFEMMVEKDCNYTMLIAAKGYIYKREKFSTTGLTKNKTFTYKTELEPLNQSFTLKEISFTTGSSQIEMISEDDFAKITTLLKSNSEVTLLITGHTDLSTEDNTDSELSIKRAETIAKILVQKGIKQERLTTSGVQNSEELVVTEKISKEYKFLKKGSSINAKSYSLLRTDKEKSSVNELLRRIDIKVVQPNGN